MTAQRVPARQGASRPARTVARNLTAQLGRFGIAFGLPIVALLLWQLATSSNPNVYFPPPFAIFGRFVTMFFSAEPANLFLGASVYSDVLPSLARMLSGFLIGAVVGVAVGLVLGLRRVLGDYVNPIVEFLRSVPATATLPIFLILLGGGDDMRVAFIAFGLTWYVLINTTTGVAAVEPGFVDMARAFRISRARTIFAILLPAASPKIFAGLRIGLTGSLLLSVVSEFFLATNGIGFQLIQSQRRFFFLEMWSWMLLLAILGYLLNTILELIERRLLSWHSRSHAY